MVGWYASKTFGDIISPLSPTALAYYKFKYEGDFTENGQLVNKIRVIPKASGENVFSGVINIIEDSWYIHSLDLKFNDDNSTNNVMSMDVLIDTPIDFETMWVNREIRNIGDKEVTIVSIADLIMMKQYAGRLQDERDIILLSQMIKQ